MFGFLAQVFGFGIWGFGDFGFGDLGFLDFGLGPTPPGPDPARAGVARAGPVGENVEKPLIFLVRKRRARSVRSKCRKRRPEIFDMRRKTKDLVFGPPRVMAAATTATDEVSSGVQAQSSPRTQGLS